MAVPACMPSSGGVRLSAPPPAHTLVIGSQRWGEVDRARASEDARDQRRASVRPEGATERSNTPGGQDQQSSRSRPQPHGGLSAALLSVAADQRRASVRPEGATERSRKKCHKPAFRRACGMEPWGFEPQCRSNQRAASTRVSVVSVLVPALRLRQRVFGPRHTKVLIPPQHASLGEPARFLTESGPIGRGAGSPRCLY